MNLVNLTSISIKNVERPLNIPFRFDTLQRVETLKTIKMPVRAAMDIYADKLLELQNQTKTLLRGSVNYFDISLKGLYYLLFKPQKYFEGLVHTLAQAKNVDMTLRELKNLGYDLPKRLSFQDLSKAGQGGLFLLTDSFETSTVKLSNKIDSKIEQVIYCVHEVGHFLHVKENKMTPQCFLNLTRLPLTSEEQEVFKTFVQQIPTSEQVRQGVLAHCSNPAEFIAFYFQNKIIGVNVPEAMTEIYKKYKGPQIKGILDSNVIGVKSTVI